MVDDARTIVFDFDGTLCTRVSPGEYDRIEPRHDVIGIANAFYDSGYKVVIYTARGMETFCGDLQKIERRWRAELERWLLTNGVRYDELIFGKPSADLYIDDKCINIERI